MTTMPTLPPDCGILVVGHGTADPIGVGETRRLAATVAAIAPQPVELGFLEIREPTIFEGLARLRSRGVREVIAAPLLLFTAGHARRDVPEALREAAERLGLGVRQAGALGRHPDLLALSRRRRAEVAGSRGLAGLAFIVRGASDPTAPAQAAEFLAASLAPPEAGLPTEIGFVAAARPGVDEALDRLADRVAAGASPRRVLVQPHLLFHGHVEDQVADALLRARDRHPAVEWLLAHRLGPGDEVARALIERVAEAAGTPPRPN